MILITALDDGGGMAFHGRRQSMDRVLRERILTLCGGAALWMNAYTRRQFSEDPGDVRIRVAEDFLDRAQTGEFCFAEVCSVSAAKPERLILFRWNRVYPADLRFDLPDFPAQWRCIQRLDFSGTSHPQITQEVYERA